MKHRQQAQVKPLASLALKRAQAARLEPWRATIAPLRARASKHCPTCWALRCAQAAGTGGTFSELGTLHGGSPSSLQMAQRRTAQLKPWRIASATIMSRFLLLPSPGWEFRQETRTGVGLGVVWPSVRMNGWEIY